MIEGENLSTALQERAEELDEAERSVLGALLSPGDAADAVFMEIVEQLEAADFYAPRHQVVYEVACTLRARREPCDPITVARELTRRGDLNRVGGAVYLHVLLDSVPTLYASVEHAKVVRDAALLRSVAEAGTRAVASARAANDDPAAIAERAVEEMRAARDRGLATADAPLLDLGTFLAETPEEPDWVIPGVLARWDRLIITGGEGGGKSLLLRQIMMRAAAGLHPWKKAKIKPVRCMLIDAENSRDQARPWLGQMAKAAKDQDAAIDPKSVTVEFLVERGIDLGRPADRAYLARRIERAAPDLIVIGPLYKLVMSGNPNDEETARVLMSALEMLRTVSKGAALLIEAHSPHAAPGKRRDLRPIGSSLWLRWPEFGFGISPANEVGATDLRLMDWVPWRGARSERVWPEQFCEGHPWPWQAIDYTGNKPLPAMTIVTQEQYDEMETRLQSQGASEGSWESEPLL
ncbi:AAA family ATPase [Streptomyces sp. NPDC058297]|uniref:AAA family ATPase n=1 Tax=Streptomyces sp. NPDC058297 TaxID=3346433 RepID=UPI0036E6458A